MATKYMKTFLTLPEVMEPKVKNMKCPFLTTGLTRQKKEIKNHLLNL